MNLSSSFFRNTNVPSAIFLAPDMLSAALFYYDSPNS